MNLYNILLPKTLKNLIKKFKNTSLHLVIARWHIITHPPNTALKRSRFCSFAGSTICRTA